MEFIDEPEGRSWIAYHVTRIQALTESGEYEKALALIDDGLKVWNSHPFLLSQKATVYSRMGRPDKTVRYLREVCEENPFLQNIRAILGRNLIYLGYYHAAHETLRHFDVMTIMTAGHYKVLSIIARFFLGETKAALEFSNSIIEAYVANEDAPKILSTIYAIRALCHLKEGKIDEAWSDVTTHLIEYPEKELVAYAAGAVARARNEIEQAENWFHQAIETEPFDIRARRDLADMLAEQGRIEEETVVRKPITGFFAEPTEDEDPFLRGEELIRTGRYSDAVSVLTKGSEKFPDDQKGCILLATARFFSGDYLGAIKIAESAPETNATWKAVYIKAASQYMAGMTRDAYKTFISAAARDRGFFLYTLFHMTEEGFFPDPPRKTADAMVIHVMTRDGHETGLPLLETLAKTNPDVPEYRALLAFYCVFTKRYGDAAVYSAGCESSDDPDYRLIRVLALRLVGALTWAEELAHDIMTTNPEYIPALSMYVRTLVDQDRYRDAYTTLVSNLPDNSSDLHLMDILIRCLIRSGDYHDAAHLAYSAISRSHGRPGYYTNIAKAFMLDQNYTAAQYSFRTEFLISSPNPESIIPYVQSLLMTGEAMEAEFILQDGDHLPDTSEVRYLKTVAAILSGTGDPEMAGDEYAASVFKTEDGTLRSYIGDLIPALRLLADEIKNNPRYQSPRIAYAQVLLRLEQTAEGLHQLSLLKELGVGEDEMMKEMIESGLTTLCLSSSHEEIIMAAGDDPVRQAELLHERVKRLKQFGVTEHAVLACKQLIRLTFSDPAVRTLVADGYHMLGDLEDQDEHYETALSIYEQLTSENPDDASILADMGIILNNLSRYAQAEPVLTRALAIDPDSAVASSGLCWALSVLDRNEEALKHGTRAVLLAPDEWGGWNNRGLARLGLGDLEGAVQDFKQAIRCSPGEKIARFNLCSTLNDLGDPSICEAFGEIFIRFGHRPGEETEGEESRPVKGKIPGVVAGYMDGYW